MDDDVIPFVLEIQKRKSVQWEHIGDFLSYRDAYDAMMHRVSQRGGSIKQARILHGDIIKCCIKPVPVPAPPSTSS